MPDRITERLPVHRLCALWRLVSSHHYRHFSQGLMLVFGLVCGVALWVSLQQVNAEARQSYALADQLLGNQVTHWIESPEGVPLAAYVALRRAGWRSVFPVVERRLVAANGESFTLLATDVLSLISTESRTAPSRPWQGLLAPPYQAWVPENLARKLEVSKGERLILADGQTLPATQLAYWPQQGNRVFVDLAAIADLLVEDKLDYLGLRLEGEEQVARLQAEIPPGLRLKQNYQQMDLEQLTASLHTHLDALGLLAFVVGLFIVIGAARISLQARGKTLLTARLLGAKTADLWVVLLAECFALALLCALAGIVLGSQLAKIMLPALSASLQGLYGASLEPSGRIPVQLLPGALFLGGSGLLIAVVLPLRQWMAADPLILMRSRERALSDTGTWRRAAIAALLILPLTVLAFPLAPNIQIVFGLLGVTLWAGAAQLPLLLNWLVSKAATPADNESLMRRWVCADAKAQLPALRLGLAALLLTVAAAIGVGTMVGSFRSTLDSWLSQRLSADLYLQSDPLQYEGLTENLRSLVTAVHRRNGLTQRVDGQSVLIRGLNTDAPDSRGLPLAAQQSEWLAAWFASEPGYVLINEQASFRTHKRAGDLLPVIDDEGEAHLLRIAGVFHDYGNPRMQWYLPFASVEQLWPDATFQGAGIWLKSGSARSAVENLLQGSGMRSAEWLWQDTLRNASQALFERTFAVTATMGALLLMLGISATVFAHAAILGSRTDAFRLWRALGVSDAQRLVLAAAPTALFAIATCLLAAPFGLLLAWLLIRYVNVLGFGWTMPFQATLTAVGTPLLIGAATVVAAFATAYVQQQRSQLQSSTPRDVL